MKLLINHTYETATGHIIPRSHFKESEQPPYAIFEVMERTTDRFTVSHNLLPNKEVKKALPHKVCKTIIPRNVRLSEAPSFGVPVIEHDTNSRGAYCYRELAKEIIKNNR